jgi:hypothetical protein
MYYIFRRFMFTKIALRAYSDRWSAKARRYPPGTSAISKIKANPANGANQRKNLATFLVSTLKRGRWMAKKITTEIIT